MKQQFVYVLKIVMFFNKVSQCKPIFVPCFSIFLEKQNIYFGMILHFGKTKHISWNFHSHMKLSWNFLETFIVTWKLHETCMKLSWNFHYTGESFIWNFHESFTCLVKVSVKLSSNFHQTFTCLFFFNQKFWKMWKSSVFVFKKNNIFSLKQLQTLWFQINFVWNLQVWVKTHRQT